MADNYQAVAALADALVACGLRQVCISPGSRSTPLAVTFARHPDLAHWVHHDERSAAFFALGMGRATGTPAAVITTSGTATAELYPAVIEARFGRVPLLVLTADRPPSLRGTGANQTIDQVGMYGTNVKFFRDVPVPADLELSEMGDYARAAWEAALTAPVGPVHLNLPFDEPLIPVDQGPTFSPGPTRSWNPAARAAPDEDMEQLGDLLDGGRTLLIAGPLTDGSLVDPLVRLAAATGAPVLADPLSGLRTGSHDRSHIVGHGDALAQAGFLDRAAPRAAIRFGPMPVSKAINGWLASHPEVGYTVVDTTGWPDPGGTAQIVEADPGTTAMELAARSTTASDPDWLERWRSADAAAEEALLGATDRFSELSAVATVLEKAPDEATVWVASSMPIRQVDLMLGTPGRENRLLGNRGASGIDGFISSALGSAVATGDPTMAVAGDLSLLYDLTALAWAGRHRVDLTIVVVNNDGGGIFSLLPQAPLPEFEELFGTPHGLDFADAARWAGVDYALVTNATDLGTAVSHIAGPRLVEVPFERAAGAAAYREAIDSVRAALGPN